MRKFSWQTMLIFIVSLLLAVVLLGLATAHIAKLKQRQLSDNGIFDCVDVKLRLQPTRCAWPFWGSAGFSQT
jgi:hypothetical protein